MGQTGDADTLATSGSTYRLHAPPGVDRATGALITGLEESGSHWLWAGYEYVPPMVGFADPAGQNPGTYGAQPGGNKLGSYHCWNRVYEPATGRWTTPDPAMSPWWNLSQYAEADPTATSDPTGLGQEVVIATVAKPGSKPNEVEDMQEGVADKSNSAQEFVDILTKKVADCRKADYSASECCISRLIIAGHCGSGFGGGESNLTDDQIQAISAALCPGATITNYQCWAGWLFWADAEALKNWDKMAMLKILMRKGGVYKGYTGRTDYPKGNKRPWEIPKTRFVGGWVKIKVTKGCTWRELRKEAESNEGSDPPEAGKKKPTSPSAPSPAREGEF